MGPDHSPSPSSFPLLSDTLSGEESSLFPVYYSDRDMYKASPRVYKLTQWKYIASWLPGLYPGQDKRQQS